MSTGIDLTGRVAAALHGRRIRRALMLTFLLAGCALPGWAASPAPEQESAALERRVKAAFLYKFAGFVEWPESAFPRPDAPITIAVVGSDAFASELTQAVAGRTISNRLLEVKRIGPGEPLDAIHMLFVERSEQRRLGQLAQAVRSRPVLIVSESQGALSQGSVINFVLAERRVRFEVSLDAAEKSGLRLSSRLLAVAQQVVPGSR